MPRKPLALILFALSIFSIQGCRQSTTPIAATSPTKTFTVRGKIIATDATHVTLDHEAIPGFMDAMTMTYRIKPSAMLSQLSPGDSISAELVVIQHQGNDDNAEPDSWLENIKITGHAPPAHHAAANFHIPEPGEDVPDFSFTNQNGKHISLKQYRGKVLFVTFIYTRCPFPDFCPRVSRNFAEIDRQMSSNPALAGAHLLSVSFDPAHDTPKALRDYGFSVAHTHEPALFGRWEFAAPNSADLPRIADFFALTVNPWGGMITHNLSTAVIGPEGKIVKWYRGSDWQSSDLMKDATDALAGKS